MKRYYNEMENSVYYEGRSMTRHTAEGLFSGIPTPEQLAEWGFEEQADPTPPQPSPQEREQRERLQRMSEIQAVLQRMDYLTHKEADGEPMSEYDALYGGDWHEYRRQLRAEYNLLEARDDQNTEETN